MNTAGSTIAASQGSVTTSAAVTAPRPSVANSTVLSEHDPSRADGFRSPLLTKMAVATSKVLTAGYIANARSRTSSDDVGWASKLPRRPVALTMADTARQVITTPAAP